jgi:hypothetical protein
VSREEAGGSRNHFLAATYDADPPNTIVLDEFEKNYQRNRIK